MSAAGTITVHVPLIIQPRPGRKTVVTPGGMSTTSRPSTSTRGDPAAVKAMARAFRWKRMLEEGRYASISEMAAAERIDRGYVGQILRLTLLAPDIVEAILDGRHPAELALPILLKPFPLDWKHQRTRWLVPETPGQNAGPTPAVSGTEHKPGASHAAP